MPTAAPPNIGRDLDLAAVDAALARLARAPQTPWLHAEVARRMAERLQIIRLQPTLVLDWWSFCGGGMGALQHTYPSARHRVVEPTPALLARSLQAAQQPWWSARRWTGTAPQGQLASAELPHDVQLVWANMMLHAVDDPPALFARWQSALSVDGFVMFSCLGPGSLRELRALYGRMGWGPPTQGFIDMHDLGDMLVQSGFADPVMDQETLKLQWDDPHALLQELRSLGGNVSPRRLPGLRTPRWRDRLLTELQALCGPDGKITLSFEVAYGHAFKAAPRRRQGEPTTVTLDEMRTMVRSGRRPA